MRGIRRFVACQKVASCTRASPYASLQRSLRAETRHGGAENHLVNDCTAIGLFKRVATMLRRRLDYLSSSLKLATSGKSHARVALGVATVLETR